MATGNFKEKYESLNGKMNSSGKEYRTISLSDKDLFVETNGEEILKKIGNKETFYLYVGDEMCPWCRSVLEMAEKVALRNDVSEIFYIEIWDDEGKEIFRDQYKFVGGMITETASGDPSYHRLLEMFDAFLNEYTLSDEQGNSVDVKEKRIYAPSFFYVENGEPLRFTTGVSEDQHSSSEELNPIILADEEDRFMTFFDE